MIEISKCDNTNLSGCISARDSSVSAFVVSQNIQTYRMEYTHATGCAITPDAAFLTVQYGYLANVTSRTAAITSMLAYPCYIRPCPIIMRGDMDIFCLVLRYSTCNLLLTFLLHIICLKLFFYLNAKGFYSI